MTFDEEVIASIGKRPQPRRDHANLAEVLAWDAKYRELFPRGPISLHLRKRAEPSP